MNYVSLYREWRPQFFRDVVGQEHITRTLQNALRARKVGHAYLFSGPRGTGKTSTAKILAKAVNCVSGSQGEPCNDCDACKGITQGTVMDVVEIDAASNRGVDEIRDLRDKVKYAPTEVQVKVYIIDEVHMLTPEAFNALLKTLEEPPGHIMFILATTEPHKLPPTIVSRCQHFAFRRIAAGEILKRLRNVAAQNRVSAEEDALWLIARAADGGMRDALSLFEQVIAFSEGRITPEHVNQLLGATGSAVLYRWLRHIAGRRVGELLREVGDVLDRGKDPAQIIMELLQCCRDLVMVQTMPDHPDVKERIQFDPEAAQMAEELPSSRLIAFADHLQQLLSDMKWAVHPRLVFEVGMIRLCRGGAAITEDWVARLEELEEAVRQLKEALSTQEGRPVVSSGEVSRPNAAGSDDGISTLPPRGQTAAQRRQKASGQGRGQGVGSSGELRTGAVSRATMPDLASVRANHDPVLFARVMQKWPGILDEIKKRNVIVQAWLAAGEPVATADNRIYVAFKGDIHRETVMRAENKNIIDSVVSAVLGQPAEIFAIDGKQWELLPAANEKPPKNHASDFIEGLIGLFGVDKVRIHEE
jgi:DNA polymerase-3 subunit gamma/tau